MTDSPEQVFRALASEACGDLSDLEIGSTLQSYLIAARAAWPRITLSDEAFIHFLAERSAPGALRGHRHIPDLWLTCGCVLGVPDALAAFHEIYTPVLVAPLVKRGASEAQRDELQQVILEKLLVSREGLPPKIADYRGTGPLKAWVATVAVSALLMARRSNERKREDLVGSERIEQQVIEDGAELRYLKQLYRVPVEAAIVFALSQLGDRDRLLLRLHLVERLSIDRLGAMYGVNRATAARWLASARAELLRSTRRELRRKLRIDDGTCDSIIDLVNSQLHVSVARHLES